ncbi:MAG: TonB-dependent receptor domain-containing protein [Bacteroidia bacterium]
MEISDSLPRLKHLFWQADSLGRYAFGASEVTALLSYLPGVSLRDYGGIGSLKTLSLHGNPTTHVGLSIEEIPLRFPLTSVINLAPWRLESFQALRLTSGGEFYPAVAPAGMLVFSLKPRLSYLRAWQEIGQSGSYHAGILVQKADTFHASLSLTHARNRFPFSLNEVEGIRSFSDYQQYQANLWYRIRDLQLLALAWQSSQELPGPIVKGNPLNLAETYREKTVWSALRYRNPRLVTYFQTQYLQSHFDEFTGLKAFYRGSSSQGHFLYRSLVGKGLLSQGLFLTQDLYHSNRFAMGFTPLERVTQHMLSGLISYFVPWRAWEIRFGLRQEGVFRTAAAPLFPWSFQASLKYTRGSWSFLAEGMRSYRLPSLLEWYFIGYGRADLPHEKAYMSYLAAQYHHGPWQILVTTFLSQTRDKIITVPRSPIRWTAYRLGHIGSYGHSATLTYVKPPLHLFMQGTYTYAFDRTLTKGVFLPYVPPYTGNFWAGWEGRKIFLGTGMQYLSWRYISLAQTDWLEEVFLWDLQIGMKFAGTTVELIGRNLLDRNYALVAGYPMPRRLWMVRWRWQVPIFGLHKEQLPTGGK